MGGTQAAPSLLQLKWYSKLVQSLEASEDRLFTRMFSAFPQAFAQPGGKLWRTKRKSLLGVGSSIRATKPVKFFYWKVPCLRPKLFMKPALMMRDGTQNRPWADLPETSLFGKSRTCDFDTAESIGWGHALREVFGKTSGCE